MDGGDELYRVLVDRCQSLEASHKKLKEQFRLILQVTSVDNDNRNRDDTSDSGVMTSCSCCLGVRGVFHSGSPFGKVLDHMGHAVLVSRADSEEIIYWNRSAERLYGYKDYEVLGLQVTELLIDEEHRASAKRIKEKVMSGQSWSGQFPFRKRSGQVFMAIVTESPLYEDDKLVGVIAVSSDAAVFNNLNSESVRPCLDPADDQSRFNVRNLKRIQWQSPPQIASSVSSLVSKVLSQEHGDSTCSASTNARTEETQQDTRYVKLERPPKAPAARFVFPIGKNKTDAENSEKDESKFEVSKPSKIAAKVLSKLHFGGIGNFSKDGKGNMKNECNISSVSEEEPYSPRASEANKYCNCSAGANHGGENTTNTTLSTSDSTYQHEHYQMVSSRDLENGGCKECAREVRSTEQLSRSSLQPNDSLKPLDMEDELQHHQLDHHQFPNSVESTGSSHGSSSSKGDHEPNLIVDCEIRWEDLNLREEIGQGSYAVVYRGIWNGSDVAVKVYHGSLCSEETLHDYKKEIDIMRRLRHPNVLLFMGAVYSQERLAVVTEYLPRGSLFRTLHKSNQLLDIRRRLRMALDVARGMNYLHHRHPPIVHRDLKSSNLLVDKSWTVKVGDFGLSKLMNATFLTAKSGRGTPQWMAPEVLRNEPSTEKSDVFSFGVILWELMTESIPWKNLNSLQVVGVVGFMDRRLDIPQNLDPPISAIIRDCWHSNPELRPSFKEIIQRMSDLIQSIIGVTAKKSKDT